MDSHISPVDLQKAYRIINHGPTVLVSARQLAIGDRPRFLSDHDIIDQ